MLIHRGAISIAIVLLALGASVASGQATRPATGRADEQLTLTLPENTELRVLINYVGDRLGIQFLFDDAVGTQRITIKPGTKIPQSTLLNFLQVILQSRNYSIAETNQPGWKQIVPAANIPLAAQPVGGPSTQPAGAPGAEGAITQVFLLRFIEPTRLEPMVKSFLSREGGTVMSLGEHRLLIVTDYASNVARVANLIEVMDKQSREIVVEYVALEHADASDLTPKVAQVMQSTINTTGMPNPAQLGTVEVGFDQRTNQVALVGPKDRVAEAIRVVKQFDKKTPLRTVTYQFEHSSPERVDKMMKQMFVDAAATGRRVYQAGFDKDSRLLIVTGTEEVHERVEQVMKSVDTPMAVADSPIQFYKLSNTTASEVLTTIKGIQGEEQFDDYGTDDSELGLGNGDSMFSRRRRDSMSSSLSAFDSGMADYGVEGRARRGLRRLARATATTQPGDMGKDASTIHTPAATVTADKNTNSIIVVAEKPVQEIYGQLIRALDKRRPQVLIECTLVTLDTSSDFRLGVDVGVHGISGSTEIISFSSFGVSQPLTTGGAGSPATGRLALVPGAAGFNGAILSPDVADIVVNAFLGTNRAKVVSAPRILVNDNAEGSLVSNSEQPTTTTNIGDTISTTTFDRYVSAGTEIVVKPHISEANYLQLKYSVALNSFTGSGSNGIPAPRTNNELESTVTIPDGSTIIIGGLNSSSLSKTKNMVPILGQIPVLEYLFSSRNTIESERTLFVFIRPVILRDDQFQDLKYLSEKDVVAAGIASDDPRSEPLIIE